MYISPTEPLLSFFNCSLGPEGLTALCESSLDGSRVSINYMCSYDDSQPEDCEQYSDNVISECACLVPQNVLFVTTLTLRQVALDQKLSLMWRDIRPGRRARLEYHGNHWWWAEHRIPH